MAARRLLRPPVALLLILVLAGCSSNQNGSPGASGGQGGAASASAATASSSAASSGSAAASGSAEASGSASASGSAEAGASGSPAASSSSGSGSAVAIDASGTLNVMGFDCTKGDDIATSRIAEFKKKYPQVTLNCAEGGLDDQQFLTAVQSGNPPDLIYIDRSKIGTFASKQAIQPMDDCVSKAGIQMSDFRDAAVQAVNTRTRSTGSPEFLNVSVVVTNNKVASEAGVDPTTLDMSNWDALKSADEKMLKKGNNKITRLGFDPKLPEFLPLWAKINGVDIISADGKTSNLADPKVAEALGFARDLILAMARPQTSSPPATRSAPTSSVRATRSRRASSDRSRSSSSS